MKKFMVLFLAPVATLDEWMKLPEAERKPQEEKMMKDWQEWSAAHPALATDTSGMGKTKKVTKGEVSDTRNDLMLSSVVEGESQEAVADAYKDHPHFGIPGAWIEVVALNPIQWNK